MFTFINYKKLREVVTRSTGGRLIPPQTLLDAGVPPNIVQILIDNHSGETSAREKDSSHSRYRNSSVEPDPSTEGVEGVYSIDFYIMLAGKLGLALAFPYDNAHDNGEYAKVRILHALKGKR